MDRVTAELCQKQIRHCYTWIERFMQSQEDDSLQQFGILAALLPLTAALIQTEAVDSLPDLPDEDGEDDEEQKVGAASPLSIPTARWALDLLPCHAQSCVSILARL